MLLMASTAVLFDVLVTMLVVLVCTRIWSEKRKAKIRGGSDLITVIMRESVLYWVAVLALHSINSKSVDRELKRKLTCLAQCKYW